MSFYSPYQYIPCRKVSGFLDRFEDIRNGKTRIRHDRWVGDHLSGSIECLLTTKTPTMIGGPQHADTSKESPTHVDNYRFPQHKDGKLAIPGNSLRGMIGNIIETISLSSLRILDDEQYIQKRFNRKTRETKKIKFKSTTHKLFLRSVDNDPNILPWGSGNRDSLTPAEALFGVVDATATTTDDDDNGRNLASRLIFHDALVEKDIDLRTKCTMKILGSPKPPSPIMYLHHKKNQSKNIKREQLDDENTLPNGRKYYLHHPKKQINKKFWETAKKNNQNQKMTCSPIPAEVKFRFRIDFDNLKSDELGLLLSALEPDRSPIHKNETEEKQTEFWHRIGLGKPLGLGSVQIEIQEIQTVNRSQRYSGEGVIHERYSPMWTRSQEDKPEQSSEENPWKSDRIDENSFLTLCLLGRRNNLQSDIPVSYPYIEGQQTPCSEQEGFRWFMNRNLKHNMGPVTTNKIPMLDNKGRVQEGDLRRSNSSTRGSSPSSSSHGKVSQHKFRGNLHISGIPKNLTANQQRKWEQRIIEAISEEYCETKLVFLNGKAGWGFVFLSDEAQLKRALDKRFITIERHKIYLNKANK